MTETRKLIAEYVDTGSEEAFHELVCRYLNLVYSSALRVVGGNAHLAEDVSQAVFTDLARLARTLPGDVLLGGWLHRHTCFVALNAVRGERRRQARERQAVEMKALEPQPEADLSRIAPLLDAAINDLAEPDRKAILLRFFEHREFREIGQATGCNEDAARMRVKRALEKLELMLKKQGISSTAAALSLALSAGAVQAAPAGLASAIAAAALGGMAGSTATVIAATKIIAMTALQKTLLTASVALLAGAGLYEARQAMHLRAQNEMLRQQQAPLTEQIRDLQRARDDASNRLAGLVAENSRLASTANESQLLKLRGELGVLRQQKEELQQLLAAMQGAGPGGLVQYSTNAVDKESWGFVGYDTPEAALQSVLWAKSSGNEKVWLDSWANSNAVAMLKERYIQGKTEEERTRFLTEQTKDWLGLRILRQLPVGDDTVLVQNELLYRGANGKTNTHVSVQEMRKIGGAWKFIEEYN